MHVPASDKDGRWVFYVILATFSLLLLVECGKFLSLNGMFSHGGWTQISIARLADNSKQIMIYPGRAVHVHPGQYVKLWVPFFHPATWFYFRKYFVQSWEPGEQHCLQLFESARGNFSEHLERRVGTYLHESVLRTAFFTGPYGISATHTQYETLLLVTSELGILSMMAYVRHSYHCIKGRTSKTRRLRLVWQVPRMTTLENMVPLEEVNALQLTINEKLNTFSKRMNLPRLSIKLIQYHLGRYVPSNEQEQQDLNGKLRNMKKEISNRESDFREFDDEIRPLNAKIEWYQSHERIMYNILCWLNSKFDDIKRDCVREIVLAPAWNVMLTIGPRNYIARFI